MSYLERLKNSENTADATLKNQINPPEDSSLGFFGAPPACIEEKQEASVQKPGSVDLVDDRIDCVACRHFRAKVCGIATPGGAVSARQGYRPVLRLQRCAGYLPVDTDNDQRPGSERWPGLLCAWR